jgi:hypothetical protein
VQLRKAQRPRMAIAQGFAVSAQPNGAVAKPIAQRRNSTDTHCAKSVYGIHYQLLYFRLPKLKPLFSVSLRKFVSY